ncbi:hypothetical protein ACH4EC_15410 [Streptomyces anulatus]
MTHEQSPFGLAEFLAELLVLIRRENLQFARCEALTNETGGFGHSFWPGKKLLHHRNIQRATASCGCRVILRDAY